MSVTTAITLEQAIAKLQAAYNVRMDIVTERPITLLGGKKNPMQGRVFKRTTTTVDIGDAHKYGNKVAKAGKAIATTQGIEKDEYIEHEKDAIQALWKGMGEHVSGGIVRHKGTGELYFYYYPTKGSIPDVSYTFEGKAINPDDVEGFNEKARTGTEIALTDGTTHETDVKPIALKVGNLKVFHVQGEDETYMIIENI